MNTISIEQLARVVHEANRAYQEVLGQPVDPSWPDADWRRQSTIESVLDILRGNTDFKVQHERWMAERIAAGWTHGAVKDAEAKTNPLLLPWEQLPETEKAKNNLRLSIVQSLAHLVEKTATA